MADKQGKESSGALAGFLLGAALGSLGALLVAPRSGRETRQQLRTALQELSQITESLTVDFQVQAERLSDQALQQWEDTLTRLREAIAAGIEASQEEARNQQRRSVNRNTITVPAEPSTGESSDPSPTVESSWSSDSDQGGTV
ncbi:MAG: YtxH domain-containing protein [Prochlorotrichaceae cyanobacterium]